MIRSFKKHLSFSKQFKCRDVESFHLVQGQRLLHTLCRLHTLCHCEACRTLCTHNESFTVVLPALFDFFFPGLGCKGVFADPDSKRTVFNNRNPTLWGASVWFHGSRQSCLNITLTPLVPHRGAPPQRLHSSYFYWRQEEIVSKYGCASPSVTWKRLLQVRVMCACAYSWKDIFLF